MEPDIPKGNNDHGVIQIFLQQQVMHPIEINYIFGIRWHNHTLRWSELNPPNQTKILYRHVWRPLPYFLQTVIVDDLKNPAYIPHCT